jgi:hypothetical protein
METYVDHLTLVGNLFATDQFLTHARVALLPEILFMLSLCNPAFIQPSCYSKVKTPYSLPCSIASPKGGLPCYIVPFGTDYELLNA